MDCSNSTVSPRGRRAHRSPRPPTWCTGHHRLPNRSRSASFHRPRSRKAPSAPRGLLAQEPPRSRSSRTRPRRATQPCPSSTFRKVLVYPPMSLGAELLSWALWLAPTLGCLLGCIVLIIVIVVLWVRRGMNKTRKPTRASLDARLALRCGRCVRSRDATKRPSYHTVGRL